MANGHHRSFNDSRFAELSKSKTRNYIRKNCEEIAPLTLLWSNVYGQQFFDDIERNDWRKDRWKIQENLSSCFWFFQRSILVYLSQREVKISNMQKNYQNKYTWSPSLGQLGSFLEHFWFITVLEWIGWLYTDELIVFIFANFISNMIDSSSLEVNKSTLNKNLTL